MKSVKEKYLEMNHNFIELYNSIVQKVKDEKPIENDLRNDVFDAISVLNHFLDVYKGTNRIKTETKENDKIESDHIEESDNDYENIIITDPSVWKSVMKKGGK